MHDSTSMVPAGGPRSRRLVVVGDVNLDVIVKPEGPLVPHADRRAEIRLVPGGSGANLAIWLGSFGVDVVLAAKVGSRDRSELETAMVRHGVTPRFGGDEGRGSGIVVSLVDPDGQRSFLTDRGANLALDADDLPDDLLDGAALLHVSGYAFFASRPRAALSDLVVRARRRGVPFTVDPASASFLAEVGPEAFLDWTAGAAICFPNDDEAAVLAGSRDQARQREFLASRYDTVVIKRGRHGAEVVGRGGAVVARATAAPVVAVDTTGAGDAFVAGFLAAHLRSEPVDRCLRGGVAAGTAATRFYGGQPWAPVV